MRIGHGYDVHAFAPDRKLILAGVTIDHELGLAGHSDADVVTHALMDALLGAAKLPDIGELFPDTDETYRGTDSIALLQEVAGLVRAKGYAIEDVDITIACQAPKLKPYKKDMAETLADALQFTSDRVGVKATTTEGLGFVGRKEGIAAWAVVLLGEQATYRCC